MVRPGASSAAAISFRALFLAPPTWTGPARSGPRVSGPSRDRHLEVPAHPARMRVPPRRLPRRTRPRLRLMVNLTRIYTRTGDAGETRLGDMSVTTKNDPRLHAYADVDEANAQIGVALALGGLEDDVVDGAHHRPERPVRRRRRLLHPGRREPGVPAAADRAGLRRPARGAGATSTTRTCRTLRSFILNGGTPGRGARCTWRGPCTRRAERSAWAAYDEHGDDDERAGDQVPQPALGPAVHPGPARQPRRTAT